MKNSLQYLIMFIVLIICVGCLGSLFLHHINNKSLPSTEEIPQVIESTIITCEVEGFTINYSVFIPEEVHNVESFKIGFCNLVSSDYFKKGLTK